MENKMENNCLVATYDCFMTYKTDYNLQEVHEYWVKYGTLYVVPKKGDEPIEYEVEIEGEGEGVLEIEIMDEEDAGF